MAFSSTIQVLKVEFEERTSKRTGNKYDYFAARCVILTDAGDVDTVGVITSDGVTPEFREKVKPGTYRAVFAFRVADYGPRKGEVVALLTDLAPVALRQPSAKPAPQ